MRARVLLAVTSLWMLGSCSDAGLYTLDGRGPLSRSRAQLEGTVCAPVPSGDAFPVKVLFALQGGTDVPRDVVGQVTDALGSLTGRFSVPYITFSLMAFHTVATGLEGSFVNAAELQPAIARYGSFQEQGPVSLRAPLRLARSLLSGDMQVSCRGTVARTRYVVVLLVMSGDTSCQNPAFNAGIDSRCDALLPDEAACSNCELAKVAGELKALSEQFGVGEVVLQPIYLRQAADPLVSTQVAAIARAGGTEPIETDPANVGRVLNALNYASLQSALALKRLIAFNRNALSRAGELLPDSDGDGLADDDEAARGTDPTRADSDNDALMDGLEVRMGLDPLTPAGAPPDTPRGCNPSLDTDGDRLNDCEEKLLGTEPCMGDTDSDGLPDFVEFHHQLNPLVAENLEDFDRDGVANVEEVVRHADPLSADLAYQADLGYGYEVLPAPPAEDGRLCYQVRVNNVSLVATRQRPNPPYGDIPAGVNDLYLYLQVGRDNDSGAAGIGSLRVQQVQFIPPGSRRPSGVLPVRPEEFVLGQ